jgi:putative ATP-binding cassette transporter
VTADGRETHRAAFSAIFGDFHLFDALWGLAGEELERRARAWLERLELAERVQLRGRALSTTALSRGQRKRLAFMVACLEDRPCLLFDEWAADQDPAHKEIFYRQLLPELTRVGKTVVVVTHDDRYFELGDRCLKVENGRVTELAAESKRTARPASARREPAPAALPVRD